jgi:hypothetical protein
MVISKDFFLKFETFSYIILKTEKAIPGRRGVCGAKKKVVPTALPSS